MSANDKTRTESSTDETECLSLDFGQPVSDRVVDMIRGTPICWKKCRFIFGGLCVQLCKEGGDANDAKLAAPFIRADGHPCTALAHLSEVTVDLKLIHARPDETRKHVDTLILAGIYLQRIAARLPYVLNKRTEVLLAAAAIAVADAALNDGLLFGGLEFTLLLHPVGKRGGTRQFTADELRHFGANVKKYDREAKLERVKIITAFRALLGSDCDVTPEEIRAEHTRYNIHIFRADYGLLY